MRNFRLMQKNSSDLYVAIAMMNRHIFAWVQ